MKRFKLISALFWGGIAGGITIGNITGIIISLCIGGGKYYAVMPQLQVYFKTEIAAVIAENLLYALVGLTFALCSLIFTAERMGFLYKCILHFAITAAVYLPFIMLCYNVKDIRTVRNICTMLLQIVLIYAFTWALQYITAKRQIAAINRKIEENRENSARNG